MNFNFANPVIPTDINGYPANCLNPIAFETLTVDDTAAGIHLTAATYTDANGAYITAETASIRFRVDGTAPTASVGHLVETKGVIELRSQKEIENFKAIRTGSTSAVIMITYFK
jgi:hypothetical protein